MTEDWRQQALSRITPSPEQAREVEDAAQALVEALEARVDEEGWEATPRLEGSLAKGTYLAGDADLDVFVAFDPDVDRETLVDRVHELADLLDQPAIAYAEHPYAQGTVRGHDAEIVPCYDLDDPRELRSAVDRTPFHTAYIKDALAEGDRDEVRLLKAFLTAAGCYGAKEATRGISGYLAELLVLALGPFEDVLGWAVDGCEHPIVLEEVPKDSFEDPLVVVDPVDPTRNAAAAVARPTLERFREAAGAFRAEPSPRFFTEPAPARMALEAAQRRCEQRRSRVLAVEVPAGAPDVEDPVHAQLRRAVTLAAEELVREQVPVLATATHLADDGDGRRGWILLEAAEPSLDAPIRHRGPPAHLDEHGDAFRERWSTNPQAAGPVFEEEGRLFVDVHREDDTLAAIAIDHLEEARAGKVVDAALDEDTAQIREAEAALVETPPEALAALLDRRRPWERTAERPADGWARAEPDDDAVEAREPPTRASHPQRGRER